MDLTIKPFKTRMKNKFDKPLPLSQKHFTMSLYGKRGSGKSIVIRNVLEFYKDTFPKLNRFFCSPTALNDDTLRSCFDPVNVFTNYSDNVVDHLLQIIEDDEQKAKDKIYERVIKDMLRLKKYEDAESIEDLDKEEIEKKYKKALKKYKKPNYVIVFSDCQGLIRPRSKLMSFIIRHRHYSCSIIMDWQVFREAPVVARTNTMLSIIFDTSDKEVQKLEEEFNNFKGKNAVQRFFDMFHTYVNGWNFLLVNRFLPKTKQYWQNFTHQIDMEEFP
jgi:Cdc6-like AAA superfamily ATPase